MFETSFTYASATPLPPNLSIDEAIEILHDFETVMKLSPDCRGTKKLPPPKTTKAAPNGIAPAGVPMTYWEVEDDLPFMPKRLWNGGVHYNAEFLPAADGCDIVIHAPCGFTSTNHWRLLREVAPLEHSMYSDKENLVHNEVLETLPEEELSAALERVGTKDLLHARTASGGAGWYVEIISDAKCPRTFVSIIKGFLKNSHAQLQHAFIDRLKVKAVAPPQQQQRPAMAPKRPTLSRRRSSVL